jgi:hypothetical protein
MMQIAYSPPFILRAYEFPQRYRTEVTMGLER